MRENKCVMCGCLRNPKAKIGMCQTCKTEYNRKKTSEKYYDVLTSLGFTVHTPKYDLWDKLSKYDVTNNECGHRFQAQGGNIMNGMSKCSVCGPSKRIKHALKAYVIKYGRTYDLKNSLHDYTIKARSISHANWIAINKERNTTMSGFHLDHIVPISWAFNAKLPVEIVADIDNLALVAAKENLTKGDKLTDFNTLSKLLKKFSYSDLRVVNGTDRMSRCVSLILERLTMVPKVIDCAEGILEFSDFKIRILDADKEHRKLTRCENEFILFSDEIEFSSNADRRLRRAISRINNRVGNVVKMRASKMEIREITALETARFLDTSHFQGRGAGSRIKLGLFLKDELMSVMTFGKPRFNKQYEWELIRFASKIDHRIYGAGSKLFDHFVKKYNPNSVISYSDRRWGNGGVYKALGFYHLTTSKPNYWWSKDGRRITRYETQLDKLAMLTGEIYDATKSEKENMIAAGWNYCEDLGNDVFIWKKSNELNVEN